MPDDMEKWYGLVRFLVRELDLDMDRVVQLSDEYEDDDTWAPDQSPATEGVDWTYYARATMENGKPSDWGEVVVEAAFGTVFLTSKGKAIEDMVRLIVFGPAANAETQNEEVRFPCADRNMYVDGVLIKTNYGLVWTPQSINVQVGDLVVLPEGWMTVRA